MKKTTLGATLGPAMGAAAIATVLGAAPLPAMAADQLVIVEVAPVASELAAHLRASPDTLPPSVDLPEKLAAVVCKATLKQLRDSKGGSPNARCVAVGMSQGLIQAVRQKMKNP